MLKRKIEFNSEKNQSKDQSISASNNAKISKYFKNAALQTFEEQFLEIQKDFNLALLDVKSGFETPVKYVYNPIEYAWNGNEAYVRNFCKTKKKIVFIGMNPGPFGMCQTGVPFGNVKHVRDWLRISCAIGKPDIECPNRLVYGLECQRTEVSGDRFWGFISEICITPENFFKNCFVYNYCPLALLGETGTNITPNEIKKNRKELENVCDEYYKRILNLLEPEIIIAIGGYMRIKTKKYLKEQNGTAQLLYLIHPSPRSRNNQNWKEKALAFFQEHNLIQYMQ